MRERGHQLLCAVIARSSGVVWLSPACTHTHTEQQRFAWLCLAFTLFVNTDTHTHQVCCQVTDQRIYAVWLCLGVAACWCLTQVGQALSLSSPSPTAWQQAAAGGSRGALLGSDLHTGEAQQEGCYLLELDSEGLSAQQQWASHAAENMGRS